MSSVTATNAFDALNASGATSSTSAPAPGALGQQDFLNLMLAQLKNQDRLLTGVLLYAVRTFLTCLAASAIILSSCQGE
jgi:hypothetical protein